jgi:hypothetical protein
LALLPQFAVAIAKAVLNGRPRVALGLPHLFEDLAVPALEADIDGGVVGRLAMARSMSAVISSQSGAPSGSLRIFTGGAVFQFFLGLALLH